MRKIAVVLFNLGGPDSLEAVQPFLFNLFNDKAIIGAPQPFRWLIARLISARRAPVAQEIYEHLGGSSPLVPNTEAQASALVGKLSDLHPEQEFRCFLAMRYWHPMAESTAAEVKAWEADEIVLLPLYPQFSTTTSGSSFLDWRKAAAKLGLSVPTKAVCCYPRETGFIAAAARRLSTALADLASEESPRVLFSAHGLPKKIVDRGDPYQWAIEQTASAIVDRLGNSDLDWRVSYQSRVGPLEWIKPYTEDEIRDAGSAGKPLIIVPIAFVSEHSETLVELDIEYRELAEQSGVTSYTRVGTVSCDPEYIDGLAEVVLSALQRQPGLNGPDGLRICPGTFSQCPIAG